MPKKNIWLTEEANERLERLQEAIGVSQSSIIREGLRLLEEKREGTAEKLQVNFGNPSPDNFTTTK